MASSAAAITPSQHAVGRVARVADGDSFVLKTRRGETIEVRLHAIDAPELAQVHGPAARDALVRLIGAQSVEIACYKRDRIGRSVCRASIGGRDIELEQLQRGHAWHDTRFTGEQNERERAGYAQAQRRAQRDRRGIWAQRSPMPPWICRERQRRDQRCR